VGDEEEREEERIRAENSREKKEFSLLEIKTTANKPALGRTSAQGSLETKK
jgi:hypothetical protein